MTYDVETGGQIAKRELPFAIAVLAELTGPGNADAAIVPLRQRSLIEIDRDNLDAVIAQYQPAESTRQGLEHLVSQFDADPMLQIKVLDANRQELQDDLVKAVAFDQSVLFKRLYEATYGTFGGTPFSLLLGDYDIGRSEADVDFLTRISRLAAALHAPFVAAAAPTLFGLTSFADLAKPRDLRAVFESTDSVAWNDFRTTEEARYVALTLPRVDRSPADSSETAGFSAAYVLAARIGAAISRSGWPAQFQAFQDDRLMPEIEITVSRSQELARLGFMPLCRRADTTETAFTGVPTTALPKRYLDDEATVAARRWAELPAVLVASRIAHYLQVSMRERVGSFLTRANVETFLNDWVAQYVLLDEVRTSEIDARYPLREARVAVTEVAGQPGAYRAALFVRPQFQMPEFATGGPFEIDLPS